MMIHLSVYVGELQQDSAVNSPRDVFLFFWPFPEIFDEGCLRVLQVKQSFGKVPLPQVLGQSYEIMSSERASIGLSVAASNFTLAKGS